jgi:diaminopimelate epimerase
VNFIEKRGANEIAVRTYERGVEDETLACGTGVVASALVFAVTEKVKGPITVIARGGDELRVGFNRIDPPPQGSGAAGKQFRNVTLTGPAEFAFEGTIEI